MLDARAPLTQDSSVEWVQVRPRGQERARRGLLGLAGLLAMLLLGSCTGPGLEPPLEGRGPTGVQEQGGTGGVAGQAGGAGSGGTGGAGGSAGLGGLGGQGGAGGLIDGSGVGDAALDLDEDAGIEDED